VKLNCSSSDHAVRKLRLDGFKKRFYNPNKVDGVAKSPLYCIAAILQELDIPYVLSHT
jgi:hypothetical protein